MHRKGGAGGRFFGRNKQTNKQKDRGGGRVHRTNLQTAALPVLLLFQLLRYLAYQVWVVLSVVCRTGAYALPASTSTSQSKETQMATGQQRTVVGPGEPALAKQKHHHRKAFEFISKALKIDEEDHRGILINI